MNSQKVKGGWTAFQVRVALAGRSGLCARHFFKPQTVWHWLCCSHCDMRHVATVSNHIQNPKKPSCPDAQLKKDSFILICFWSQGLREANPPRWRFSSGRLFTRSRPPPPRKKSFSRRLCPRGCARRKEDRGSAIGEAQTYNTVSVHPHAESIGLVTRCPKRVHNEAQTISPFTSESSSKNSFPRSRRGCRRVRTGSPGQ